MEKNIKIIRSVTVAGSVGFFVGLIPELKESGYDVVSVSSDGPDLEKVREAGARALTVEMERQISPFKDLKSLWKLVKVFRKEKPQMVHSMTPKAGLLSMIAGWICGVPVRVHTFTGLVFPTSTGIKQKVLMLTDRITCACATHIIPEGEGVKNDLMNFGITRKPLKVLGHGNVRGIDLDRFNPEQPEIREAAEEIRKEDCFTFIFVGRLVKDKGINELVKAFSRLNKQIPSTRLILVGRYEPKLDPLESETLAEIEKNQAIEAVGEQRDVRGWLASADAFVFPSYREGFPNVVIEAGAMELPSIVTDINGSREIIRHGVNGVIIPAKDEKALHDAMLEFVEFPDTIRSMSMQARPLISSRYDYRYVRKCLKDFYKEIISK